MKATTVTLPAFLASALVNGDVTGLEDRDLPMLKACEDFVSPGRVVSCDGEPYFKPFLYTRPAMGFCGDVLDYTVLSEE